MNGGTGTERDEKRKRKSTRRRAVVYVWTLSGCDAKRRPLNDTREYGVAPAAAESEAVERKQQKRKKNRSGMGVQRGHEWLRPSVMDTA